MNFKLIRIDHANPPPEGTRGLWWYKPVVAPGSYDHGVVDDGMVMPDFSATPYPMKHYSHYIPDPPPPYDPAWNEEGRPWIYTDTGMLPAEYGVYEASYADGRGADWVRWFLFDTNRSKWFFWPQIEDMPDECTTVYAYRALPGPAPRPGEVKE